MTRTDLDAKLIIAALRAGEPVKTLARRLDANTETLWRTIARDHPDMAGLPRSKRPDRPGRRQACVESNIATTLALVAEYDEWKRLLDTTHHRRQLGDAWRAAQRCSAPDAGSRADLSRHTHNGTEHCEASRCIGSLNTSVYQYRRSYGSLEAFRAAQS